MNNTCKTVTALVTAMASILATTSTATAEGETTRDVSVLGTAAIAIPVPASVFEISVHARGDNHSGTGVFWMSHHNDERIGWMVARVDCVRTEGRVGIVTAVVSDAQDFAVASPGDPIALTVRDNGRHDIVSFASREQVTRCQMPRTDEIRITSGDLRVGN